MINLICLALAALAGCVERELTITSEPPGALVFVSDQEVGRTPLKMPFTWYGDYEIIVRMEGYDTLKTHARLDAPIYEIVPFDLFSELAPWTYRDYRYLHYKLKPFVKPSDSDLIDRATRMEKKTLN